MSSGRDEDLIAIDDALNELAEVDPESYKVVELRFLGGYTDKKPHRSWVKAWQESAETGSSRVPGSTQNSTKRETRPPIS